MVRVMTLPLLLLLGLWGLLCPLWAIPPGYTPFQWFEIQHIQPNPLPCDQAMIAVNNLIKRCKPRNTFLHDDLQNVTDVCTQDNTTCKNGQNNCHQSVSPVNMTDCMLLRKSQFPNCHYRDRPKFANFTVACDPPQQGDPQYPLVPVHFDQIV
ncbi:ribonuclease K3-like [Octodon degus]|uniref:Ribonuclease K6 n=1 Tax=Octodon degus TaxID=10160 RepID=A0A6P3V933_OCTDE|nr:ribonuclease K3-like [Octodon degus]